MATPRPAGGRLVTSRPPISTLPSVDVSSPAIMRRHVVLPHPDGPSSTVKLPEGTCNETPSNAVTPPKRRLTRVNRTSEAAGLIAIIAAPVYRVRATGKRHRRKHNRDDYMTPVKSTLAP